jgi:hypothetical protein
MFCFGKHADVECGRGQSAEWVGGVESSSADEGEIPQCGFVIRDEREEVMRESTLPGSHTACEEA